MLACLALAKQFSVLFCKYKFLVCVIEGQEEVM